MTHKGLMLVVLVVALASTSGPLPEAVANECPPVRKFGPGHFSTDHQWEWRLTFSPSRLTAYWSVSDESYPPGSNVKVTIVTSHWRPSGWTPPTVAPFSGAHTDIDPFITLDGRRLYFSSNRPVEGEQRTETDLWVVHRTNRGWSPPVNLGPAVNSPGNELYPSADLWGNLYFGSDREGQWDIWRSSVRFDGSYRPAEKIGPGVNTDFWEFNPEISPDGRMLLFASAGRADSFGDVDLYVSRLAHGRFGRAENLGACVNTAASEFHPTVLWERRQLVFVRVGATGDFYVTPLRVPR
ncbi:MAG: hypothetical protein GEV06_06835 [Luteitalea sp.]|nr:hypothetical protein [Luteitalea sp.]